MNTLILLSKVCTLSGSFIDDLSISAALYVMASANTRCKSISSWSCLCNFLTCTGMSRSEYYTLSTQSHLGYLLFVLLNLQKNNLLSQKLFKLSLSKVSMENCLNHNDAITDEVKGAWEGMNKKMHILLTNFVYSDNKFQRMDYIRGPLSSAIFNEALATGYAHGQYQPASI